MITEKYLIFVNNIYLYNTRYRAETFGEKFEFHDFHRIL
ncbi:hypothetical protein V144x_56950 [Gimesia aquarii]|uniref:Uncharacterized protein n=1 Tax=Gimesia aquarii TaxID=2527964 RepID=A0A517W4K1_9PLAN|nr:hypothetical protein V144x_56950 [Gimesia aquarii]